MVAIQFSIICLLLLTAAICQIGCVLPVGVCPANGKPSTTSLATILLTCGKIIVS